MKYLLLYIFCSLCFVSCSSNNDDPETLQPKGWVLYQPSASPFYQKLDSLRIKKFAVIEPNGFEISIDTVYIDSVPSVGVAVTCSFPNSENFIDIRKSSKAILTFNSTRSSIFNFEVEVKDASTITQKPNGEYISRRTFYYENIAEENAPQTFTLPLDFQQNYVVTGIIFNFSNIKVPSTIKITDVKLTLYHD